MTSLSQTIHNLNKVNILVIGDLILDRYVQGEVDRISPEGPIPVLLAQKRHEAPGGAANVACNLAHMGANVFMAGIVGHDSDGRLLKKLIKRDGVDMSLIISDDRPTSVKTRFLSQGQQLLRLDEECTHHLNKKELSQWWQQLKKIYKKADLIVLSDYLKGVFSDDFLQKIFNLNLKKDKPILVDPKGNDYTKYKGATLITPNLRECSLASGIMINDEEDLLKAARKILRQTHCQKILVTRGRDGMSLIGKQSHDYQGTIAQSVYDVSGAGDSSLAAFALGWANRLDATACMHLANLAGGVAVSRLGAHPVNKQDLLRAIDGEEKRKIINFSEINSLKKHYHRLNKRTVLTSGCFDLLHSGHLSLLREAKAQGDILIVGINSDQSIKKLKGPERPIADEHQRAHLLAGFSVVDHVVVFQGNSPQKLIEQLKPNVWVKGADYQNSDNDPVFKKELKAVIDGGGQLYLAKFIKGKSTTELVNKIRSQS